MPLPTIDDLMNMEVSSGFGEPVPIGPYHGVITGAEVKSGAKGPYIKLEVTIHDEEYRGRKVWRNAVSFSEKAIGMPGGVAELMQTTKPELDRDIPANEVPAAIAAAVLSTPIGIVVEHEQIKRQGVFAYNPDGTPEMRATIAHYFPAEDDFIASVEAEAAGIDDDLPF